MGSKLKLASLSKSDCGKICHRINSPQTSSNLYFGTQFVDASPLPRIITLTNVTTAPVQVSSVSVTGEFAQSNSCSTVLPQQATVMLTNSSSVAITLSSFDLPSDYSQTNDCGGSLGAGARCTVNVTFSPTGEGDQNGVLTITHLGFGSPQIISVSGRGRTALRFSPPQLSFQDQQVGTTSGRQFVNIGNDSFSPVSFTGFAVDGDFEIAENPCPNPLPAIYGCLVQIIFRPQATGFRQGAFTVVASDSPNPHIVPLSDTGVQ